MNAERHFRQILRVTGRKKHWVTFFWVIKEHQEKSSDVWSTGHPSAFITPHTA